MENESLKIERAKRKQNKNQFDIFHKLKIKFVGLLIQCLTIIERFLHTKSVIIHNLVK